MGSRRCGNGHGGVNSLVRLIFSIVSFSITLAFKIVEVVFQAIFGLLSGIGSGSRNAQTASYTVSNNKQEATGEKPDGNKVKAEAAGDESKNKSEEVRNKDFYVVLFILTIIPAIVAMAMGKLFYAGVIGAVGFGLMIVVGVISGIAGGFRKRADEKEAEEYKEDNSVEMLIKDAFEKLFDIRKDIIRIKDADIRLKTEAICCTGEKIIGEVRTNPEGLTHVRKFFYYYLDAFGEIVKKYLRLSSFEESSEEIGKLVAETEKSFADIDRIFKDLCEKLLEKDMMSLKAEINVIKNSN
ncbi:MAG: 5-bromo-4-chloroindolyl phosphate hydrolysis family protein [Clostridiaceae bacterium]|nr:5-bromo-4-chloroindolyl phosphate hydrolysis family protein [Clostridiaceae bacterium]